VIEMPCCRSDCYGGVASRDGLGEEGKPAPVDRVDEVVHAGLLMGIAAASPFFSTGERIACVLKLLLTGLRLFGPGLRLST